MAPSGTTKRESKLDSARVEHLICQRDEARAERNSCLAIIGRLVENRYAARDEHHRLASKQVWDEAKSLLRK